jgi:hypothetical protein
MGRTIEAEHAPPASAGDLRGMDPPPVLPLCQAEVRQQTGPAGAPDARFRAVPMSADIS